MASILKPLTQPEPCAVALVESKTCLAQPETCPCVVNSAKQSDASLRNNVGNRLRSRQAARKIVIIRRDASSPRIWILDGDEISQLTVLYGIDRLRGDRSHVGTLGSVASPETGGMAFCRKNADPLISICVRSREIA